MSDDPTLGDTTDDATPPPTQAPEDWQTQARAAGYSWGDINGHVASASAAALDAGYTPQEVDSYLGYSDPAPAVQRFTGGFSALAMDDPSFLDGLSSTEPKLDLTKADWRGDYARSLMNGEVKGAEDFVDHYAASALNAAHTPDRLDDSNGQLIDARTAAAARAANDLVGALPPRADFVDAALAIDGGTSVTKDNLMRNWRDNGQSPIDAAIAAQNDPDLKAKLTSPLEKPEPYTQGMDEFQRQLMREHPEFFEKNKDAIEKVSLGLGLTDADTASSPGEMLTRMAADAALLHGFKLAEPYVTYYGGQALRYGFEKLLNVDPGAPIGQALSTIGRDIFANEAGKAQPLHTVSSVLARADDAAIERMSQGGVFNDLAARRADEIVSGDRIANPIEAFHASPHDFDSFSTEYLGTGEAGRAKGEEVNDINRRGNGLYFSTNPDIHDFYLGSLGTDTVRYPANAELGTPPVSRPFDILDPHHQAAAAVAKHGGREQAAKFLESISGDGLFDHGLRSTPVEKEALRLLKDPDHTLPEFQTRNINDYRVKLHVTPDKLLDLDAPIKGEAERLFGVEEKPEPPVATAEKPVTAEQSDAYEEKLSKWYDKLDEYHLDQFDVDKAAYTTGQEWFDRFSARLGGTKNASDFLASKGVVGTQYLDAASRGATENPTRNYVMFHASPVEMFEKNGQPVTQQMMRQQTEEMTAGYKALGGFTDMLKRFGGDLLSDESGALKLFPASSNPNWRSQRDFMEEGWRTRQGVREQTVRQIAETFEPLRKTYNAHQKEWLDELAKGPAGNPMGTVIGQMVSYVEGRSAGVTLPPNHPLMPLADALRNANKQIEGLMQAAEARGEISVGGYFNDYLRHAWKDRSGNLAEEKYAGMGKLGSSASFQARTHPTMSDGLQAGLVPKIPDLIDLTMWDITSKLRYMDGANQLSEAANLGHGQWGRPDPMAIGSPKLDPLNGGLAKRNMVVGKSNGLPVMAEQQFYAEPGFARSWNNMVDRGLFDHPVTAKGMELSNYASNMMTAIKLLNPLFHVQTVGTANIASGIAQGLEEGARADFGQMMKTLGGAIGRPVTDYLEGRKVNAKYLAGNDPAVQMLAEAGLRINRLGTFQVLGRSPDIWTSLSRGSLRNEYRASINEVKSSWSPQTGSVWEGIKSVADLAGMTANKAMSAINSPVFGHLIPTLQAGAAYRRMQSYVAANPMASPDVIRLKARDIVRDVENRMGELNMDTVFWPNWAKQTAHSTLLSTSWVYGTYRGLAAAAGLDIERGGRFSARLMGNGLSSVVGTVLAYSMANSLANYIHTGELPGTGQDGSWQDFLNYRTGEHTKSGLPKRGMIPSELKEIYDLGSIVAKTNGPMSGAAGVVNYALGKVNPLLQMARPLLPGELSPTDAIGHHIEEQPGGTGRWMAEQVEPIFWNALFGGKKNSGLSGFERFLGEKEAPKWVTDYADFQRGIGGVREKFRREEISRARKEEAQREYPSGYDIPAPASRGGSRGGGQGRSSGNKGYQPPGGVWGAPR
jgi:hypothetical protein